MRYAVVGEHSKFFRENHYIEFDSLLTESQLFSLNKSIEEMLRLRMGKLENHSSYDLFLAGRDLSRSDKGLRKIVLQSTFAEILSELVGEKPLRFAYDQVFYVCEEPGFSPPILISLKQTTALQGKLYGLLLCLKEGEMKNPPFPSAKGNGTFFSEELVFSFDPLYKQKNQCYLLIVFIKDPAIVISKEEGTHPFAFKKLGYNIGDALNDELNPVLVR